MSDIRFTKEADRDLIDIFLHGIDRFGSRQAEQFMRSLKAKIETLGANPGLGVDYGTVLKGARRYWAGVHAVYYRPTATGILVLRILHGRMDPGRHLLPSSADNDQ